MDCFWYACDDSSSWSVWGRWVLLACIIVFLIIVFFIVYRLSSKRFHEGREPIAGTSWLVHTGERLNPPWRGNEAEVDPVPPYLPQVGDHDAGYYDPNGQFVAKGLPQYSEDVEYPPKAATGRRPSRADSEEHELDFVATPNRPNDSPV